MVEDNTTPAPMRGGGINPTAKHMPAAMNTNTHRRSKHETRVHHPVPKPPEHPAPLKEGDGRIEDSRRSWPGGDARSHSEPGS